MSIARVKFYLIVAGAILICIVGIMGALFFRESMDTFTIMRLYGTMYSKAYRDTRDVKKEINLLYELGKTERKVKDESRKNMFSETAEGRVINIPALVTGKMTGKTGAIETKNLTPQDNWCSFQRNTGAVPLIDGRYKIVVGPKVLNPSIPDDTKLWPVHIGTDKGPAFIDAVLQHKTTGEKKILNCIMTDGVKAHTYNTYPDPKHPTDTSWHTYNMVGKFDIDSGLVQTGISYPNSSNSRSEWQFSTKHIDSSVIEFDGKTLDFDYKAYRLLQIIVLKGSGLE